MGDQWSDIDEANLNNLLARKRRVDEMWRERWLDLTQQLCSYDNSKADVVKWLKDNHKEVREFLTEWASVFAK